MKIIEIIVSPDGQTRVETKGYLGRECRQASRFLEAALGKRIGEQLTGKFHQVSAEQTGRTYQQG